jgi:hypothetical protein
MTPPVMMRLRRIHEHGEQCFYRTCPARPHRQVHGYRTITGGEKTIWCDAKQSQIDLP